MADTAANRVPDEILSEILTPLLKHSDEEFTDQSTKPLLDPGYSSSSYLLVCKAWLRVATPLLYNVAILRTTAQAEALKAVLKTNKEFGLFIKKLRVEGGFGPALATILECATNLTDLYLTLFIGGSDNVKGLCSGLPLVNPRRVIVVDTVIEWEQPKKNKKVTELLTTLLGVIPKWDKLQTFHFPYAATYEGARDSIIDPRAEALASVLAKTQNLETLIVPMGESFPQYFRQLVNVPSLKSIHFIKYRIERGWLGMIRDVVDRDPQLKALVTYSEPKRADDEEESDDEDVDTDDDEASLIMGGRDIKLRRDEHGNYLCPEKSYAYAEGLPALKQLGETIGGTLKCLTVYLCDELESFDPNLLTPFTSLTVLDWGMENKSIKFLTPGPGFSALPLLEELTVKGCIFS
ncbi:F-box domain-containing protein [Mycena venus]|uniref:F-box domain-containing protein n=1 Tax=Mycena venus TaxID=2733690 RepID=A0A8H6WX09_9AGAR|nr:F-box domain-containing protein [Mycena venus]